MAAPTTSPTPAASTGPLAGAPAAVALVRAVAEDPDAPRLVAVTGPAGAGKSTVLRELVRVWTEAGAGQDVTVVDDAHELGDDELADLRGRAGRPGARLVVAFRPWPRSRALARLGATLAAAAPPLVLGALDAAGIAARAARLAGVRISDEAVRVVAERTAGAPVLVDRLLAHGRVGGPVPPQLAEQIGYAVDAEDPRVVELVTVLALGAPVDGEVLVPLLGISDAAGIGVGAEIAELDELSGRAVAAGLCTPDGRVVPLVAEAIRTRVAPARRAELRRHLAEIELDRGGSVLAVARTLRGSGATGERAAAVFRAAAAEAARAESPDAVRFYAEAVAAGAPPLTVAAHRAQAHLVAGDLDGALGHADSVLSATDAVEATDAVRAGSVAAAVLARRGLLARSAELYRWTAAVSGERPPAAAVPVLIGTGALEEARAVVGVDGSGFVAGRAPTLVDGADDLTARGMLDSVEGSPTAALSGLARAAGLLETAHGAALLPDTPAALAALVAVHTGEFDVAASVLDRALRTGLGGAPARARHRLLLGWIALLRGATGPASERLAAVDAGDDPLEPRDEFLAAALQVAIARRQSDLGALMRSWTRARQAIVRHPVDLYVLQPLGELVTAASRLREESWVAPHLAEADALLDRLGRPALWVAPLHWARLQAAVLTDDVEAACARSDELQSAACGSRFAHAMATAAPHWVGVLEDRVDAAEVEAAARGLHAVGLSFDGGRLAGQAALRTGDRRAVSALLACARALQAAGTDLRQGTVPPPAEEPGPVAEEPAVAAPAPVEAAPEPSGSGLLSERELEVAELVVQGRTQREIGKALFISAKTVEHHVARMRQRLGVGGRSELLDELRRILGDRG
ncbi:LuxR C-terminal-related transcriptional regulator [Pseudonocardia sp. DR1-2]|uniref:helix-turn-helix transcriptional regulator n=1 Tax=Pseudonocardia sp. DR1-2 TaxID=2951168 RepID=UPI002044BBF9|nr:LuxR C-terminal-related transcriptional regulator [Pseudonocardia sp. DR1-2]MCM3846035.1 LuxR C-terminal-related transcriptional regulator [Pseudonocardia sp. DR1-2]